MDHSDLQLNQSSKMSSAAAESTTVSEVRNNRAGITFEFPKIPCTKFNVIGNSKMRAKRERRQREPKEAVWRVPRLIQTTLAAGVHGESHPDTTNREAKDGMSVKRGRPFWKQDDLNSQDKASLYAARSEDSFKGFEGTHNPKMVSLMDDRFKTEKRYIARFYRQRSSALLSPILKKCPSRTFSISLPSVVQEYDLTDATKVGRTGRAEEKRQSTIQLEKYHTRECLYCDVAGQKYCSECRRKHRHIKMRESSHERVKFPKLPSCQVQIKDREAPSTDEVSGSVDQFDERFHRYRNKDRRTSSFFDEPPAHFKGNTKGKGRKTKVKHTILPRIYLPAITNDSDNRHL
ncbi:uncharacterized protein LOC100889751 [Strongylocentrotus purpuratus]|uniref:Uncharacterized protein n=1 Tax=Strongylocentrotus purpuratus TaxID=7668 RepID=A0A7M7NZM8_STRPU|nr:uncharacterized protein LOC100889751 [Strongylocentrotus purpuratus]